MGHPVQIFPALYCVSLTHHDFSDFFSPVQLDEELDVAHGRRPGVVQHRDALQHQDRTANTDFGGH